MLLVIGLFVFNITASLKICAFNVQSFGESKVNNKRVMEILIKVLFSMCATRGSTIIQKETTDTFLLYSVKILSRCDLCLIQEVRDSKGEAVQALVNDLNRYKISNLKVKESHLSYERAADQLKSFTCLSADLTTLTHTHM